MPRRHDARDHPAEAGRERFLGRLAKLLSDCRSVRGWRRPRIVVAGITAVAAAVAIIASSGASGAAGSAWWSIPAIAAGTLLAGLTVGSYLGTPIGAEATVCDTRWPILGLAGLALGSSAGPNSLLAYLFNWATPTLLGAVIQPAVSLAAVALLGWALRVRLDLERTALAPVGGVPSAEGSCPTCRPLFPQNRAAGPLPGDAPQQNGTHTVRSTTRRQ